MPDKARCMDEIVARHVGIPFLDGGRDAAGADCWGLVLMVYRAAGIELPDYQISAFASEQIGRQIERDLWQWKPVMQPATLDIVIMSLDPALPGVKTHCGVVVGDGAVLHTLKGVGAHVVRMEHPFWRRKIEEFHRWTGAKPC